MQRLTLFLALSSLTAICLAQDPPLPRELGRFSLPFAAFVDAFPKSDFTGDPRDLYDLYITTFNAAPFSGPDPVYRLQSPGRLLDQVDQWPVQLGQLGGDTAYWPNFSIQLPKQVSGFDGIVQTSGFLVMGKTFGQLEVYNTDGGGLQGPWNIAEDDVADRDYSYHWVVFKDVDADGLDDVFTARFNTTLSDTTSQLLWMKNPGNLGSDADSWTGWEQNLLLSDLAAPDVVIQFMQMEADGTTFDVLVTGELWSERVMLYYVDIGANPAAWSDPANIQSTVLADDIGVLFEASPFDINRDGSLEILVSGFTTNGGACDGGVLWAFVLSGGDFRESSSWRRERLAEGFTFTGASCANRQTPGHQKIFYPSDDYFNDPQNLKPLISLSGDDDGKHYILYPASNDANDFTYDTYLLVDTGATTAGTQTVLDLDGDGYVEIVSAGYSAGEVYVHTYAP